MECSLVVIPQNIVAEGRDSDFGNSRILDKILRIRIEAGKVSIEYIFRADNGE